MTCATLDIDGYAERVFGYIIPDFQYSIIPWKGWAERNEVIYTARDKCLTIGSGLIAVKILESRWMDAGHIFPRAQEIRRAKGVLATIFAAEIRCGHKRNQPLHVFSVSIAEINKALDKLDKSCIKKSFEEIVTQLPVQLQHLARNFLADEDGVLPQSRPGWDHVINLEQDNEGKVKQPPSGPLYGMLRDELLVPRKTITDYLNKGWIQARNSPANAPVLFAKKPGGGLQTLRQLSKVRWLTKLDICTAFHRLRIRPDDEGKTAFRTRNGQYEWLVMPFGLCGGPATFQRYINAVLQDLLDEFCLAYMDDVIIYSEGSIDDHYNKVQEVIHRLEKAGLRLDLNKCAFGKTEVKYLGFIIKAGEGVTVDPSKVEAIKNWDEPKNTTEIRSFSGFANFYREFIPKFSAIAQPLINLTSKQARWIWETTQQKSFNRLKKMLASAPLLALFSPDRETVLEADGSGYATGAVVSQVDEKNRLGPIGYFSRKLNPAEVNYDLHDKELLAIVATMRHLDGELRSVDKPFTVISDHQNLRYFSKSQQLSERQIR
ncbi:hypothetical protein K3495_g2906 [Podosphaera aphanis]|nr:hypothetical protein K3495_g2906 [Podosphaera aphanis]